MDPVFTKQGVLRMLALRGQRAKLQARLRRVEAAIEAVLSEPSGWLPVESRDATAPICQIGSR